VTRLILLLTLVVASVCAADEAATFLDEQERKIISELNLARTNPKKYVELLKGLRMRYDGKLYQRGNAKVRTMEGVKAVDDAIAFVAKVKPLKPLRASKGMSQAAGEHAAEQAATGGTGHAGKNGSQVGDRVNRHGNWRYRVGENISYGNGSPRDMVLQLIVDDGVANRGHRKNIFEKRYKVVGVGIDKHPRYGHVCVTTYAGDYKEK
jgi:uncharacterized protein YkwD